MKNNKISYTQLQAIVFLEMIGMESMILPKIGGNIYTILIMSVFTVLFVAVSGWLFNKFSYMKLQGIAGKILQFLFSVKIALVLTENKNCNIFQQFLAISYKKIY